MSFGRTQAPSSNVRDYATDYRLALIAEYHSYVTGNLPERAAEVAAELRRMGEKVPGGVQRAIDLEPLERAVPADDAPTKRPGRPRKVVDQT